MPSNGTSRTKYRNTGNDEDADDKRRRERDRFFNV